MTCLIKVYFKLTCSKFVDKTVDISMFLTEHYNIENIKLLSLNHINLVFIFSVYILLILNTYRYNASL